MNKMLDNVLISISTISLLLFLKHFLAPAIITWSLIMIGVGLFILLFALRLINGNPHWVKTFLVNTVGLILLVGGINFLMENYSANYWWAYGIFGIFLYQFHHLVSERL